MPDKKETAKVNDADEAYDSQRGKSYQNAEDMMMLILAEMQRIMQGPDKLAGVYRALKDYQAK